MEVPTHPYDDMSLLSADDALFGWDPTPGIVSVWASRSGKAWIWQRMGDRVRCTRETFRPWLFATTLDDLAHLGSALQPEEDEAMVSYRVLDGPDGSYRYLLSARDGRVLERALLDGASRRLNQRITSLSALGDTYYRVGPVEQYLMSTGRVFFRGMAYHDLHRLQFDLETTSLDPARGRIFLVAVRDNRGFEQVLEAATPAEEATLIADLCALIRQRDPDTIENHNLMGFDLPFLEHRARVLKVPLYLGREGVPNRLESYDETGSAGPHRWNRKRFSVAGRELIDTLDAVRRYDFVVRTLPSYRLKEVARHFGLASSERVYVEGARVYETYLQDPDSVRHYALDDVREVDGLSRRLMGAAFALAGMAPRRYERIASAGPAMGILEPLLVQSVPARRNGTASNGIRPGRDVRTTPGRSNLSAGGGGGRARRESRCRFTVPIVDARVSHRSELRSPGCVPAPDRPFNRIAFVSQSGSSLRTNWFHRG